MAFTLKKVVYIFRESDCILSLERMPERGHLCQNETDMVNIRPGAAISRPKNQWDHFDILAKGKTDYHCKIKETFSIQELEPAFNVNVGSEKRVSRKLRPKT